MASRNQEAWKRHYANTSNHVKQANGVVGVPTQIKANTYLRSVNTSARLPDTISGGSKIIVEANTQYDPNPIIYTEKGQYRVEFDSIYKPSTNAPTKKIRPSELGLSGRHYTVGEFYREVKKAIHARDDLDGKMKAVMIALVEWADGRIDYINSATLKDHKNREIIRDFGEVIAPLAVLRRGILSNAGLHVGNVERAKIFLPIRSNMPLIDYMLIVEPSHTIISAKKKGNITETIAVSTKTNQDRTNVVKVSEIIRLVNENGNIYEKWKQSRGYQILNFLNHYGVDLGILYAANFLKTLGENPFMKLADGFDQTTEKNYVFQKFADYFAYKPETRNTGLKTYTEMLYYLERDVIDYLNHNTDAVSMFMEAVKNKVIFTTFGIVGNSPKIEVITADTMFSRNLKFRSKNTTTRRQDKIGIQI